MAVYAGPEVVTNGLVLALDAGNSQSYPGSGTAWTDLSGRGVTATLTNGPTFSSGDRGSIVFDGTNDYGLVTQTLTTPFTITGFIRYTDQAKTFNTFINTNPHTVLGISLNRLGSGELYVYIGNGTSWLAAPSIISSSYMNVNQWYQIAFTSTGSGSTLYLNGVNVGTSVHSPSGWGSTYYFGAANFGDEYLKGNISNIQIYNRALSAAEIRQNYNALKSRFPIPTIVTEGLTLHLDAANPQSYPGSGTTWTDLSGNGYNFNINASAYSTAGGIPHMNFEGSYGAAKRVVSGSLANVPNFANGTIMCFTTILNSTSTWRTLTRGASSDHQVIIAEYTNTLGMFDNGTVTFKSSGFDITTLPNPYTKFNCLTWRLSQSSPYYQFQYNDNSSVSSITDVNATFNNGFSIIGAYHNDSTAVNTSSQYWGKISVFLYYNRHLTSAEISQNFNALRGRFGV